MDTALRFTTLGQALILVVLLVIVLLGNYPSYFFPLFKVSIEIQYELNWAQNLHGFVDFNFSFLYF